ncbi:Ras family domain containing protein, putative [Eimeria maxima]|uniref:Ras family domain containing protein, putative n=1 Tax=Eimeria maxima TaxID=5804 RepID=U6M5I9_EIMMA|nr:Ras family domain containing protein, putative [Eimeria maxima]CDJ59291.1 Ras family domain containing protein, putative [Eimeria maxima]
MDANEFPLLRITILGSEGCGKTSIADAFVNNVIARSNPPEPTTLPRLLYRVMALPIDEGDEQTQKVICEVEDTFSPSKQNEKKSIRSLVDMKRRKLLNLPRGVKDFTPFSLWRPPIIPHHEGDQYRSIAHGRMGFLIVFDVTDPASFNTATELLTLTREFAEYRNPMISPVIFLVANKTDVDTEGDAASRLLGRAELYAQQVFCRLWQGSAFTGKNIKRMFVDMAQLILSNGMLWELDYHEESASEESEEDRCAVM